MAIVSDLLCLAAAIATAAYLRDALPIRPDTAELGAGMLIVAPLTVLGWIASIAVLGGYQERIFGAGADEFKRIFNASFVTVTLVGCGCYVAQYELSRGFFLLCLGLGPVALLGGRLFLRRILQNARRTGSLVHNVLVVGTGVHVAEVREVLQRESWLGYRVVGSLVPDAELSSPMGSATTEGQPARVAAMARAVEADVVFLTGGAFDSATDMRRLAWRLENEDIQVVIAPSVTDVSRERISVRPVGGLPLIHLEKPRSEAAVRWAKRTFDVVGSFALLVLFAPLMLWIALWVRLHDGGPALFQQTRVGREGNTFRLLKFRTMVTDAEALLEGLHREQAYQGGLFKMQEDPRITRPGRLLRQFSLDELPQLLNVLRGDMSLVGPRPPLEREAAQYDDDMARRLRVRPGLTGLWQVSGRSDLSWDEAIRLDLYYVDNWSMIQDLSILTKTLGAVVSSKGAY